ncbi:flagellar biosynthesis protein FlgI [Helicobacter monodelphidis]|uniref:flagellar basal body P-ring protein FlgI n=1 Tax=Helicobacter sp. 15-1451 TaxID=2004995 RepID=UPI000DCCA884|nr:flagellar basal body P-ring protein FlgI [Helicobacter sp. 15-1451]RAX57338.1 flagellar biosynthesis protein FlgI [Helicobacter sp. 15-1451]
MRGLAKRVLCAATLVGLFFTNSNAEKVKDIANVVGVRENQLIGYGLVVGLNGTGDKTTSQFTMQSLANMLESVNVKIDPNDIKSKNVAAVMVTARLPSFARQGDRVDALVSSIGDAKSLEGGTLILTPLSGVDGRIYATTQGAVSIGGKNERGGGINHPLAATIYNGAIIEREVSFDLFSKKDATLSLKTSNFQNALKVQQSINAAFPTAATPVATAIDPRTIKLNRPADVGMVEFLARVEDVELEFTREEKIVIDERTGTIVAGVGVEVGDVVVTHGDITVQISKAPLADDGAVDLGGGLKLNMANNVLSTNNQNPTVANLTRALQRMGAAPKDVISILQTIKRSGAISADLEVI